MALRACMKQLATAAMFASTLALGGCGGFDGVELNGKIFDWMGISSSALEGSRREPQLADRAPLVLPPDAKRLPEPGSGQAAEIAGVVDPEKQKAAAAKEREKLHLAYCRGEIQWKERAHGGQDVGAYRSPYGPCPGLGTLTNSMTKN
ncbi:MAG: hypothetical protein F9K29_16215 [Hyphomicrobiaceae bacterium]|nr:MAG: hypothetical protein F9K29_16215 [Hyphomicrobiaceae bacterium]